MNESSPRALNVAVIQGGPSAEAEVSRTSAAGVAGALQQAGHNVQRLELEPALARNLLEQSFDVAFPVTHGRLGEDGGLQGLLEVLGIPYVGSGVLACALACDKVRAKHAFRAHKLPLAAQLVVHINDDLDGTIGPLRDQFPAGIAVKPPTQGSAIGVSLVRDMNDTDTIRAALRDAFKYDEYVLVERLVTGREVTCAVLDASALGGLRALPVTEIFSKAAAWYDFESRYATGGSEHACPASLPPGVAERVQHIACSAHRALGCRDLSRVDFVVGDGDDESAVTLLEVNVIPGMTATSLYPEAAAAAGFSFPALCDGMVRSAIARQPAGPVEAIPMPG
ncbi:MAG: D-alanine--D-alanine ligase family protein [Myxococcota bacterium]